MSSLSREEVDHPPLRLESAFSLSKEGRSHIGTERNTNYVPRVEEGDYISVKRRQRDCVHSLEKTRAILYSEEKVPLPC